MLQLEIAAGLEEDQLDLVGDVILQLRADMLVCTFGIRGHSLEVRFDFGVVVDDEVLGLVRPPLEPVVANLILPVIGDIGGLRSDRCCQREDRQGCSGGKAEPPADGHGVSSRIRRVREYDKSRDLTADTLAPAMSASGGEEQRTYR